MNVAEDEQCVVTDRQLVVDSMPWGVLSPRHPMRESQSRTVRRGKKIQGESRIRDPALTFEDVGIAMWDELRGIALGLLSHEGQAHSVQPSELVLTALRRQKPGGWKVPFDQVKVTWENRGQFFGQMHRAMV